MGRPLVGKQAIGGFFGTGWRKVMDYITQGAPIVKGNGNNSTYEADQKMLEDWWEGHIQKKLAAATEAHCSSFQTARIGKRIALHKTS